MEITHWMDQTTSIQETMEVMLDYLFKENSEEKNSHQKKLRRTIEEPIRTSDDVQFSREEIKHAIESLNDKKSTWNRWDHRRYLPKNI